MQKWLLIQAIAYFNAQLGGSAYTPAQLKAAAQAWVCQGSPAKIREQMAEMIVDNMGVFADTDQPVCWTPLELEGALLFIICKAFNSAGPILL